MLQYTNPAQPASPAATRKLRRRASKVGLRLTRNRDRTNYRLSVHDRDATLPEVVEVVEALWTARQRRLGLPSIRIDLPKIPAPTVTIAELSKNSIS